MYVCMYVHIHNTYIYIYMPPGVVVPTEAPLEEGVTGTEHGPGGASEIIQVKPWNSNTSFCCWTQV